MLSNYHSKNSNSLNNCTFRIICLTDGSDTENAIKPESLAKELIEKRVFVDSFVIGDDDFSMMRGISNSTGIEKILHRKQK